MSEEIDLNSQPVPENQNDFGMGIKVPRINVDNSLTPQEVLDAILSTPEDMIMPWEDCILPSKGIYYNWDTDKVKVKPLTQMAEKILATQRLAATNQSLDHLFKYFVQFPVQFDPRDLLVGDRMFIFFYLRGITYGNLYEFMVQCPNADCLDKTGNRTKFTHTYDLNRLASTIRYPNLALGQEPFRVVLPHLSRVTNREVYVGVRFLRGFDTFTSKDRLRKNPDEFNNAVADMIMKSVVHVMDSTDRFKIDQFMNRIHDADYTAIKEFLNEYTPGINATAKIECPKCGTEFNIELPITDSFFRSAKSGRLRE